MTNFHHVHPDDQADMEFEALGSHGQIQHNRVAAGTLSCGCKAYDIAAGCDHDCIPDTQTCERCGSEYHWQNEDCCVDLQPNSATWSQYQYDSHIADVYGTTVAELHAFNQHLTSSWPDAEEHHRARCPHLYENEGR